MSCDGPPTEAPSRIPVTLVTGFLGSGKTTLINAALRTPELARTLAEHDDIAAIWCFRDGADATLVKAASIGNLKQVWTNDKYDIDWFDTKQNDGRYFMRHATQIKNIWVPYGE